jgi:peptide/nickel transport system permease protein
VTTYIVRRILQSVVVLVLVTFLVFLLTHLIPGGEAREALGPRASPQSIAQFNRINGLNLPLWDQYWQLADGYLHFRFGYSFKLNEPVGVLIANRLPKTLLLVGLATAIAIIVAIPFGVFQSVRHNKPSDHVLSAFALVAYSMPSFFIGPVLILYFAIDLHWFSYEAPQGQTIGAIISDPRALFLPVLTLSLISIASFSRFMRSSMMDQLNEDYVRTALAKGASRPRMLYGHALRNAALPIVTLVGLALPNIVGGAFITETVFNYPGMGLLGVNAIFQDDIPTLIGTVVVATVATMIGSLLADVLYAVLDPRIRYST